jgi:hypothetical protein
LKASGTVECLSKLGNRVNDYDFIWLPDDDLSSNFVTLNTFFEIAMQHQFDLSQPSLGPGSFIAHEVTRQRPDLRWRYTSFVEIMCPLFSRKAWELCKPYIGATFSSWGIDLLFPKLLGYPRRQIAIVDETPVVHTRPPTGGNNIPLVQATGIDPAEETLTLLSQHGFPAFEVWPYNVLLETYAAVDKAGRLITDPAKIA